jgi:hypothetical protein
VSSPCRLQQWGKRDEVTAFEKPLQQRKRSKGIQIGGLEGDDVTKGLEVGRK